MVISVDKINAIISQQSRVGSSLIEVLESIQARYRFLPPEALILVSERLGVPLSQAYSVATFYHAFSQRPKGKHSLRVSMGTACHVRGNVQVLNRLETKLGVSAGSTTRDRLFTLETVNCIGACGLGPIMVADAEYSGQMTAQKANMLLRRMTRAEKEHE
jgi:NADH-quinone oxidoreductase subunit E